MLTDKPKTQKLINLTNVSASHSAEHTRSSRPRLTNYALLSQDDCLEWVWRRQANLGSIIVEVLRCTRVQPKRTRISHIISLSVQQQSRNKPLFVHHLIANRRLETSYLEASRCMYSVIALRSPTKEEAVVDLWLWCFCSYASRDIVFTYGDCRLPMNGVLNTIICIQQKALIRFFSKDFFFIKTKLLICFVINTCKN